MPKIKSALRRRLNEQRNEMFSFATHPFEDVEPAALAVLNGTKDDHLLRAALRRWWIEQVGDLPSGWEHELQDRLAPFVRELEDELQASPTRPAWVDHGLLTRTINVLQRRYLTTLRVPAALRALQSVGRLAVLGVKP